MNEKIQTKKNLLTKFFRGRKPSNSISKNEFNELLKMFDSLSPEERNGIYIFIENSEKNDNEGENYDSINTSLYEEDNKDDVDKKTALSDIEEGDDMDDDDMDDDDMEAKDINEEDEKSINKDKTSSSTPSSSNSENQTSIDESEIQVEQKDEFDKKTETQLDYLRDTKGISIADLKELKEQIQNQFFKLSKLNLEDDEPLLWIMVWWKRYLREEIRFETNHLKDFLTDVDQRLLKVREFINKLDKIKQNQLTEMVSLFEHKKINLDEITEALLNDISTNGLKYYETQNKGVMQFIEKKLKMSSLINLSIGAVNIVFLLLIASKFL